ncbi:putative RNA-binding protein (virulence factor B family) [Virgibacillus halotolerans]|uniref:CvfB family protein n=1 Tax=Virgibacillus halotolerans TaxID=1071053 RepID=UPI001961E732|nr:S1-like domain-containing RNA-binding protein [Virgibacillus halotolerans]MBM7601892.1 putative RNA-binding protein (virulence factor B family) [Virgibacillus halotolerans]
MTLPLGTIQTMTVLRKIDTGYVLQKEMDEALLHLNEAENELEENETVDVFLYNDKKGNVTATTALPSVQMDAYDWAEVVEVIPKLGVFVHIGIAKEMLVSVDDLPLYEDVWPKAGDKLLVTLGKDQNGRLLAIPATEGVIAREIELAPEDLLNKPISGWVYFTSREGTAIITTDDYRGFIHHTERKEEPRLGELVQGRVIEVKEDGTLNVSLRPLKQDSLDEDADAITNHLQANDGMIPFNDKSDPEDIRGTFNMSKAAFKRALGRLMKQGKVEQREGNTYLL